ncbi:MAG: transporter [Frankiales bacterium]|nr:transporter [Frankiales bacterium]
MSVIEGIKEEAPCPDPVSKAILEVSGLTVRFGGVTAVREASIAVAAGQCCGLIGPNGAGKTTLFDAIAGQNRPASGRITYSGQDISKRGALWRSQHGIRRTFQRQQIFPGLSVEDNILAALEWDEGGPLADLFALPSRRRKERAHRAEIEDLLDRCGLYPVRRDPAYGLPLGRARMLEFARAIVTKPNLVLLDEPTSGMETADVERLSGLLEPLLNEQQCGILLVEHDIDFVMSHSQQVYVMHLGEVIASGSPAEVQSHDEVVRIYLGSVSADGESDADGRRSSS